MPRQLLWGTTDLLVKSIQADDTALDFSSITLDSVLQNGGDSSAAARIANLESNNFTLLNDPNNTLLFINNGRVTGTSNIVYDSQNNNVILTSNLFRIGDIFSVDKSNTTVRGNFNVDRINFTGLDTAFTSSQQITSSYNSGTITIDTNNSSFGRTVVTGGPSSAETINNFIFLNQKKNSRVSAYISIENNSTLSNNCSNVVNVKKPDGDLLAGDKILFTIENIEGVNFFEYQIFS